MHSFTNDIDSCLPVLEKGGLILYPTDTIWGIGCDATHEEAVQKIFSLKKRTDTKAMITLLPDESEIKKYVLSPGNKIFNYLKKTEQPTTVIYDNGINIAPSLISADGSLAIRIVKDDFCKMLLGDFKKPIVSTSANISGDKPPAFFREISEEIKNGVDYIVRHRRNDIALYKPSTIIKLAASGKITLIRK